jgi:hypothetical protein
MSEYSHSIFEAKIRKIKLKMYFGIIVLIGFGIFFAVQSIVEYFEYQMIYLISVISLSVSNTILMIGFIIMGKIMVSHYNNLIN